MSNPLPQWRLLPASAYRRMRWSNGGGWTSEIVRVDDPECTDGVPWLWRLSIAELEHDGPFSVFPGVERELIMLSGGGLNVQFADGANHRLRPFDRLSFAGERLARGTLIDGTSRDFNLMWQRARMEATLWQRALLGNETLPVQPGQSWVLHVLSGQVSVPGLLQPLVVAPGDTALLNAHSGATSTVQGEGEILLIRLAAK